MTPEYTVSNPPTKPGVYRGLADAVYRAIPAVSQSVLKRFVDCPRKWKLGLPIEPTKPMDHGALVDSIWLLRDTSGFVVEPTVYLSRGMLCPLCKTVTDAKKCAKCKCDRIETDVEKDWSNNSDTCREWRKDQETSGKRVVTRDMWQQAMKATSRLSEVAEIKAHRERCDVQVAVVSMVDDILVKGLIDLVPRDGFRTALGDLKFALTADPALWPKYVYKHRLHWQGALYLDIWNKETAEDLKWFYHFVSESEDPFEPCMMPLSQDFINLGRRDYRRALRLWGECQEKGEFPGYEMNRVAEVEPWMLKAWSRAPHLTATPWHPSIQRPLTVLVT